MTAEARILRRLRQAPDLLAEMEKLEAEIKAKVRRETDRIARVNAPGKSRKTRREERNERAAEIRAAVMARADGFCEWCARDGFVLEWHHLIGGGLRRHREAVDTTAAICPDCHRAWERGDLGVLTRALGFARDCGSEAAVGAVEHRIGRASRAAGGTR